jgi:hypothetical protein
MIICSFDQLTELLVPTASARCSLRYLDPVVLLIHFNPERAANERPSENGILCKSITSLYPHWTFHPHSTFPPQFRLKLSSLEVLRPMRRKCTVFSQDVLAVLDELLYDPCPSGSDLDRFQRSVSKPVFFVHSLLIILHILSIY